MSFIAPVPKPNDLARPWEGTISPKPWNYDCTVIIPVLDTPEPLEICIALLQAQTIRPYILVIDTGSTKHKIETTSEDVEVHYLRSHGWQHPSEPVAVAQDLGFLLCKSEFCLSIHADCFLRKQTCVAELIELTKIHKIVGFQISPRPYLGWEKEVGHTLLMCHMPTIRAFGLNWNLQNYCERFKKRLSNSCFGTNCPDTETEFNYLLLKNGLQPLMLGAEENRVRNVNDWFDHPRSHTSAILYDSHYVKVVSKDMDNAIADAKERLESWKKVK